MGDAIVNESARANVQQAGKNMQPAAAVAVEAQLDES